MIIDLTVGLLVALLGGILALLPVFTLPVLLTSTWPGDVGQVVAWANGYFPVADLGLCIGILLALRALLAVWKVAVWLYDRFPFKFT